MSDGPLTQQGREREVVYLLSSLVGVPADLFQGYAFVGHDFVVGQPGADQLLHARGVRVGPGEDGCYVTVNRLADGVEIGVDRAGLKKMFVFSRDGIWCVSNSVVQMARHLREHGVPLRPNPTQLAAFRLPTTFAEQISTPATVFDGIRLVPAGHKLVLTDGNIKEVALQGPRPQPYPEMLGEHLAVWDGRFKTLLHDPRIHVSVDLSGGIDSRVVFGQIARSAEPRSLDDVVSLVSARSPARAADLTVAEALASHYGGAASLNRPPPGTPTGGLTGRESFETWRDLSLGVYLPVYFPRAPMSPWLVNCSGLGGETLRPFFLQRPVLEFVDGLTARRRDPATAAWREEIVALMTRWAVAEPATHPLVRHYREFRNRFHGGLFAQTTINLTPLGSALLQVAARETATERQIYFDLMESVLPGLSELAFDDPAKSPTEEQRRALTRVGVPVAEEPGVVFAEADTAPARDEQGTGSSALSLLADEFEVAASSRVRHLHGSEVVDLATADLERALAHPGSSDARRLARVSLVVATHFVLEICSPS